MSLHFPWWDKKKLPYRGIIEWNSLICIKFPLIKTFNVFLCYRHPYRHRSSTHRFIFFLECGPITRLKPAWRDPCTVWFHTHCFCRQNRLTGTDTGSSLPHSQQKEKIRQLRAQNPTACPDTSTEKMDIEPSWRETTLKTILILLTNTVNSAHSQSFSSFPPAVLPPVSLTPKYLNHLRPISKKIVEIHQFSFFLKKFGHGHIPQFPNTRKVFGNCSVSLSCLMKELLKTVWFLLMCCIFDLWCIRSFAWWQVRTTATV